MAQVSVSEWQEESAKVTSAMAIAGLTLMAHGPIGPMENPYEEWLKLTSEVAHTYATYKEMAWHIIKDRLSEPGPSTLLDTLFQIADRRARRLEFYMTVKYPLVITRRNFDGFEVDLIGVHRY